MNLLQQIQTQHKRFIKAPSNSSLPAHLRERIHLFSAGGGSGDGQQTANDSVQDYVGAATAYQSYVWVRKAVGKIAESLASLPVGVTSATGESLPQHEIALLLNRGNDQMPPSLCWEQYAISMLLSGECFFEIVDDRRGRPAELWHRRSDAITLRVDSSTERRLYPRVAQYVYQPEFAGGAGEPHPLPPESMIQDKFSNPLSIWRGLAPIAAVREGIIIDLFSRAWRKNFMRRGARPDYALVAPQGITKTERDELEASLIQKFSGAENWHKPIILEEGVTDIKTFSFPPRDVEWLQQQEFSRDEVGAVFGVPDEIMGYGKDTYENFQTALEVFWTLTVRPFAQHRDSALTHYFTHVRPLLKPGEKVATDFSGVGVLQDDLAPKVGMASQLFAMGVPFEAIDERLKLGFGGIALTPPAAPAPKAAKESGIDQPPFGLVGIAIPKRRGAMPGLDGNDRQRNRLERLHADKITKAFRKVQLAVVPAGTAPENISPNVAVQRYINNQSLIRDALVEILRDAAVDLGGRSGWAQVEWIFGTGKAAIGISWDLVNQDVINWILGTAIQPGYADTLTEGIGQTSALAIRRQVEEWVSNGLPLRVLTENLQRTVFGAERAKLIATTEVTRAYAEGNRAAWRASGVIERMRWQTSVDEMVCPVCRPLAGRVVEVAADGFPSDSGVVFPPSHPRCRCWVTPVVA